MKKNPIQKTEAYPTYYLTDVDNTLPMELIIRYNAAKIRWELIQEELAILYDQNAPPPPETHFCRCGRPMENNGMVLYCPACRIGGFPNKKNSSSG